MATASLRLRAATVSCAPSRLSARRTKLHEGEVERLGGQDGLDLELLGGIPPARKVLEEGVPQRLGCARDVVRRRIGVELVQAELDDAVDELSRAKRTISPGKSNRSTCSRAHLRVEDGGMECDGGSRDCRVLALDDRLDLVCGLSRTQTSAGERGGEAGRATRTRDREGGLERNCRAGWRRRTGGGRHCGRTSERVRGVLRCGEGARWRTRAPEDGERASERQRDCESVF